MDTELIKQFRVDAEMIGEHVREEEYMDVFGEMLWYVTAMYYTIRKVFSDSVSKVA